MIKHTPLLIAITAILLSGCTQTGVSLLNQFSKTGNYTVATDIAYGINAQNKLDIYRPTLARQSTRQRTQQRTRQNTRQDSQQNAQRNNKNLTSSLSPVVVFFYGGCWGECNNLQKNDYQFVAQSFVANGYTTVVADFRQYPSVNFPEIMADASQVMHWLSKNISRYGGDPNELIVVGHSSGAHIGAMLAVNPQYLGSTHKNIKGFIGLAGPYDFLPLTDEYQRILFAPAQRYAESQPINVINPDAPPLLLLHGKKDTTVGQHNADNLSRKAQSLGIKQRLILYPQHNHVGILLALSRPLKSRSSVLGDTLRFIRQHTKKRISKNIISPIGN